MPREGRHAGRGGSLRIDRLDVYHVAMPLIYPWRTAYGVDYDVHSVLVKAASAGHVGWAEATPFFAPHYCPESALSVFFHVTEVFGLMSWAASTIPPVNWTNRLEAFKGNSFAKASVEMCWSDTPERHHRHAPAPSAGRRDREVAAGADFGIQDSIDMLPGQHPRGSGRGFPRIKLKVARGWDLDVLRAATGASRTPPST